MPDPDPFVSDILSGVGAVMAIAALMLLKPLVPERRPGQTAAQYWTDHKNTGPATLFWFILEGSGIIASIAYFLEGSPIAALLAAGIIAAFWLNGPRAFDRE